VKKIIVSSKEPFICFFINIETFLKKNHLERFYVFSSEGSEEEAGIVTVAFCAKAGQHGRVKDERRLT
jgi:hypothetical protein